MEQRHDAVRPLAGRAILVTIVGGLAATVAFVLWSLFVSGTADFGEGTTYGWGAWAKNLPVLFAMFVPPLLGYRWGFQSARHGESGSTAAIIVAGAGFFWALLITHLGGLVDAFGDSPDWTGGWYLLLKVVIAVVTTGFVLRAARRGAPGSAEELVDQGTRS
jgi:hypothetical protein